MDPYTGEVLAEATYPSYDGNDYAAIAAERPRPVHRPDRELRLRAGLGLQDADRRSPASRRTRSRRRRRSRTRASSSSTGQDPHRRRRPQGPGLDDVRGRDGLLAQRRRGEGRAGARQEHPPVVGDPPLDWTRIGFGSRRPGSTSPARSAASSATRRSRRGARSTSRTARSARASAVTPIQLATAFAAMVNGGTLVQPHVVKAVGTTRS